MARPVKKNKYPKPTSGAKSGKVKKLSGKVGKKALEIAQGKSDHIEILDETSAIVHNSAKNRKESEEKKGNK